jgi:hypothetical protein
MDEEEFPKATAIVDRGLGGETVPENNTGDHHRFSAKERRY